MGRRVKKGVFKVTLNKVDAPALRELADIEQQLQHDSEIGGATLLKQFAMPLVHARLPVAREELAARKAAEQGSLQTAGAQS